MLTVIILPFKKVQKIWFLGRMVKSTTVYSSKKIHLDIFSTLNLVLAEEFIDHSIKEKNKQKAAQENKMEISDEIINKKIRSISIKERKEEHSLCLWQA